MRYQIIVRGNVDPSWSSWFSGMELSKGAGPDGGCITFLTGDVVDQVALRGILNHLWDLNLTILSVNQVGEASYGKQTYS